jgi:hypothetical protein
MSQQQTIIRADTKEYVFTMDDTKIETWTSNEQGLIVSGKTNFTMNINTNSDTSAGVNYIVPDFKQKLSGTVKLDEETDVVELRKVPIEEAKCLIHDYLKQHPGSRTSDLIIDLALEPDVVIEALSQLRCEDKVEGREIDLK